jgi:hypothetical protein
MGTAVLLVLLLIVFAAVLAAQPNPFVGVWKQVRAQAIGQQPAKSETVTIGADGSVKIESVSAEGKTAVMSWSGGEGEAPVAGAGEGLAIEQRLFGDRTVDMSINLKGQEVMSYVCEVSADGKTMSCIGKGKNPQGQPVGSFAVFRKASE